MKVKVISLFVLILFASSAFTGCKKDTKDDEQPTLVSNTNPNVEYLTSSGSFTYTKNLGTTPVDVYFIFTNTSLSSNSTSPAVTPSLVDSLDNLVSELESAGQEEIAEPESKIAIVDKPHITEFNRNLPGKMASNNLQNKSIVPPPPLFDTVTDTHPFYDSSDTALGTVPATCRGVVTNGTKTLNIYVADNCWTVGGSGRTFYVTQTMVNALASKFLQSAASNDIYDWVTNIYGEEWGAHSYSNLITATNQITILLYDIDDDDIVGQGGAFVAGYFYARDNFKTTATGDATDYSNQRIMFAIDAVLFANNNNSRGLTDDSSSWLITDPWPQELIGTLAHEFQHMIHFYQKNVRYNIDSETWVNEMCSMVTEDLLADKMQVDGPRNVAYTDPSAGSTGNTGGRLPLYNYYNNDTVNEWNQNLRNYSINYALGAYLARNFGGAQFFRTVVQCNYGDQETIEYALRQISGNTDTSFPVILRKWGVANLLSNKTDTPVIDHTMYNNGSSWLTDSLGYNLGSINLYNYQLSSPSQTGPRIYTILPATLNYSSNTYYRAASGATGTRTWNITAPAGVTTTVVIKIP